VGASRISRHERVTVKSSVGFYNLFNFANFDLPMSIMSGLLTSTAGTTMARILRHTIGIASAWGRRVHARIAP
jgi:hypothetical protein